ncbi:hypothetical protein F6X40_41215 [Paraburkholderia sp. UCT31]|uniref:hypothetical protein n=1 Tax=Paraburkholderia sp. UCT31 TaxID=2615209 RepID=UPI001655E5D8|nr:hypothetical protein [Paraburkholderia sp. UCT31]MBC8742886.1 hypothetical protein [Paraburkholderia sp. UCT31]
MEPASPSTAEDSAQETAQWLRRLDPQLEEATAHAAGKLLGLAGVSLSAIQCHVDLALEVARAAASPSVAEVRVVDCFGVFSGVTVLLRVPASAEAAWNQSAHNWADCVFNLNLKLAAAEVALEGPRNVAFDVVFASGH